VGVDEAMKVANCRETVSLERQMGWNVLLNEHGTIEHGKDHMILAGMENDGDGKRFPQKGDVDKTLENVTSDDFILMMEHDPSAWRRKIVTDGRAQLTLSGHTHKMQFSIFGWCPLSLTGKEYNGGYKEGDQQLFVTAGLGGLIPFRFGATGEIVVLTLRRE
jgi:predicted MPP superfamily phosphohydrolase